MRAAKIHQNSIHAPPKRQVNIEPLLTLRNASHASCSFAADSEPFPTSRELLLAINAQGLVAVKASLQLGGDVDPNNDEGLWLLGPAGNGILVAREGDPLAAHTIAGLSFFGNSGGNDGRHPGLNDRGQLVFQANFTNGDSGLFLFSTYAADFDLDGDVDSADLTHPTLGWEVRYSNDLDGNDFLTWQQQFGSGVGAVSSLTTVVPEPSTCLLFCVGTLAWFRSGRRFSKPCNQYFR